MSKIEETVTFDAEGIHIKRFIEITEEAIKLLDDADSEITERIRQAVQKEFDERLKRALEAERKQYDLHRGRRR